MFTLYVTAPPFVSDGNDIAVQRFHDRQVALTAYRNARRQGQQADLYEVDNGRLVLVSPAGEGVRVAPLNHEPQPYDWLDAAEPAITFPYDDWEDAPHIEFERAD